MKKQIFLPVVLLVSSIAAFVLRLLQNQYGFEPDTGLPVPGSPFGLLLPLLLAVLTVVWFLLCRKLPAEFEPGPAFPEAFRTDRSGLLLPIAGVFLLAASGILDVVLSLLSNGSFQDAMTADGMTSVIVMYSTDVLPAGLTPRAVLLLGVLTVLMAGSLFPAAAACFRCGSRELSSEEPVSKGKPFPSNLLLVAPVCLVIRLVLIYRVNSIDPSLSVYYVELLALVFLTMAFYRLSSFAFFSGSTRRFAQYGGAAVVLTFATLADGHGLTTSLFYTGGFLVLLGFLGARFALLRTSNE